MFDFGFSMENLLPEKILFIKNSKTVFTFVAKMNTNIVKNKRSKRKASAISKTRLLQYFTRDLLAIFCHFIDLHSLLCFRRSCKLILGQIDSGNAHVWKFTTWAPSKIVWFIKPGTLSTINTQCLASLRRLDLTNPIHWRQLTKLPFPLSLLDNLSFFTRIEDLSLCFPTKQIERFFDARPKKYVPRISKIIQWISNLSHLKSIKLHLVDYVAVGKPLSFCHLIRDFLNLLQSKSIEKFELKVDTEMKSCPHVNALHYPMFIHPTGNINLPELKHLKLFFGQESYSNFAPIPIFIQTSMPFLRSQLKTLCLSDRHQNKISSVLLDPLMEHLDQMMALETLELLPLCKSIVWQKLIAREKRRRESQNSISRLLNLRLHIHIEKIPPEADEFLSPLNSLHLTSEILRHRSFDWIRNIPTARIWRVFPLRGLFVVSIPLLSTDDIIPNLVHKFNQLSDLTQEIRIGFPEKRNFSSLFWESIASVKFRQVHTFELQRCPLDSLSIIDTNDFFSHPQLKQSFPRLENVGINFCWDRGCDDKGLKNFHRYYYFDDA